MSSHISGIGDTSTASKTITEEDIETFADLTGDTNPLHLDEEYAEETMFNGPIAHGTLVEGVVSAALADFTGVVIYLEKSLSFTTPVRAGDTVTAEATLSDQYDKNNFSADITVSTDRGTEVITGTATIKINPEPEPEPNASDDSDEPTSATLYFDGAARGNPGDAATGYVLHTPTETITDGRPLDDHTNNEAEYKALLDGLREAHDTGITHILIKGDSQLIVRQVTGEYNCNAENLVPHLENAHALLEDFETWSIEHIPRDENNKADAAANAAIADD